MASSKVRDYARLARDIKDAVGEDNIVVFPNGNWVTNKVFYNAQKEAYLTLKNVEITEEYVQEMNQYADELLNVSNSLIVFDLIKKEEQQKLSNEDYIEERITQ